MGQADGQVNFCQLRAKAPPVDWFAALFRASGGRVVDFTNYMLAEGLQEHGDTGHSGDCVLPALAPAFYT